MTRKSAGPTPDASNDNYNWLACFSAIADS
jgi:hypothetical protein